MSGAGKKLESCERDVIGTTGWDYFSFPHVSEKQSQVDLNM